MTKHLQRAQRDPIDGPLKHRPKGWCRERRARQAALIRGWSPWRRSTGPMTEVGKSRSSVNALKHGLTSSAYVERVRRVRHALRLAARTNRLVRLFIQLRNARPSIKYKCSAVQASVTAGFGPSIKGLEWRHKSCPNLGEDHRWPFASR